MRTIHLVDVHHSAGRQTDDVPTITREHQRRGFRTIGYHWLIHKPSGSPWRVDQGRLEADIGAHDDGQNAHSIGVCVAGDYSRGPVPPDAWSVLVATVADVCRRYGLTGADVQGHREHEPATTPTACPGFDPALLRAAVALQLQLPVHPMETSR